jgi:hypothetical protein
VKTTGNYKKIDIHMGPQICLARLENPKLCDCGFHFIKEEIRVGKEYFVDLKSVRWAKFQCGGCGKIFPVRLIDVWFDALTVQWLPLGCLDIDAAIPYAPLPTQWEPVKDNKVSPPWRKPGVISA